VELSEGSAALNGPDGERTAAAAAAATTAETVAAAAVLLDDNGTPAAYVHHARPGLLGDVLMLQLLKQQQLLHPMLTHGSTASELVHASVLLLLPAGHAVRQRRPHRRTLLQKRTNPCPLDALR
jgi:hypothetical protein